MVGGVVEQAGNAESARLRSLRVPVFAIDRLRMGTDGYGVTTLVAFMGCPLKCKYCLNPQCHEPIYAGEGLRKGIMLLTPHELYELVKIDNIYFQATGGGICFGGGEPTMYVEFLEAFRQICGGKWKLTLETCLSCSYRTIARLCHIVDHWIVDVKSMNPDIYTPSLGAHASKRNIQQFLTYFTKLFVEEVDYHIRFLIERGDNVWWLDGERVKFRAETTSKILNLMYEHPDITLASLSEQVGVNVAAINKQIRQLTNKGYIQRAADSNWRLIVTPSV